MTDLTEAMGINRSSMYAACGDKEALFKLVTARYRDGPLTYMREALAKPTVQAVVEALLYGTVDFLATPGKPQGARLVLVVAHRLLMFHYLLLHAATLIRHCGVDVCDQQHIVSVQARRFSGLQPSRSAANHK